MEGSLSIQYFRDLLKKHVEELKGFCNEWKDVGEAETIPEDVVDEIRTAVGLTNLLLGQKLKQFGDLIDDSELKRGEKEITCIDLQGFWDMVFHEVEKIQKSFQKLEKCRSNQWVFVQEQLPEPKKKILIKNKPVQASAKPVNAAKANAAAAAKQRLAEFKKKMREAQGLNGKNPAENGIADSELQQKKTDVEDHEMANDEIPRVPEKRISRRNVQVKELDTVRQENGRSSKKSDALQTNKKTSMPQGSGQLKKQKHEKKGKENLIADGKESSTTAIKAPTSHTKRNKVKDVPPLQCVTRSAARRALLQQQTEA